MSGWIKFEKSLEDDPRVVRMIAQLRNADVTLVKHAPLLVVGALARFWWYADTHIRDDDRLDLGFSEIDDMVGLPGFCLLMPSDWIVQIDERTVELPDFQEHNGVEAKRRAVTQKRVERHRNAGGKQKRYSSVTDALPDQTRPDQTNNTFCAFWEAYPKKKSKGTAERAWAKIKPDLVEKIMIAVETAKASADWRKEDGRYIPYPASWLNAKGWEDNASGQSDFMDGVI